MRFTYFGLTEAQQAMYSATIRVQASDGLGRLVQDVTMQAYRYQMTLTHVDTGALRASQVMSMEAPARWNIYIAPGARNPRSGLLVSSYAEVENDRGGEHGYIDQTFNMAEMFVDRAAHYVTDGI